MLEEKNKLERALKFSNLLYSTLVTIFPDAVTATDLDGNVNFVSPKTLKLHGFDNEEDLIGKNALTLLDPTEHDRALQNFRVTRETGSSRAEYVLLRGDGSKFPGEIIASIVKSPEGEPLGYMAVTRDLTEKKRVEEELRQLYKLEASGQLAGRFAHDFNNFLQVIKGYTELIGLRQEQCKSVEGLTEALAEIRKAEEKAETLTKQLLAFSRKQILKPTKIDINSYLKDLKKMIQTTLGENIDLVYDLIENPYIISADAVQISQIILNIILNSKDAIESQGKVVIKTKNVFLTKELANVKIDLKEGEYLELSISDTGCGMPKEIHDKIFEPYFTTKEHGKGSGLGLACVYGIVVQSNGYIFFDSEVGKGTTFRIYLPRVEGVPENNGIKERLEVELLKGNEKLIIVEDENLVRIFEEITLKNYGYKTKSARSPSEALNKLSKCSHLDLLIVDVILPEMNGKDLSEKVKDKFPKCKVLFVSGYNDNVLSHQGVLEDGVNFLAKPFGTKEFLKKVRQILDN